MEMCWSPSSWKKEGRKGVVLGYSQKKRIWEQACMNQETGSQRWLKPSQWMCFNCSHIRLGLAMRKVWCKEYSCDYGGKASQMVSWVHPMSKVHTSVSFLIQCRTYLTKTAFFHHVLPDMIPDTTFGQQAASSGLFKFFIASIFLQCPLHNVNGL